jgi:hypothetical protein
VPISSQGRLLHLLEAAIAILAAGGAYDPSIVVDNTHRNDNIHQQDEATYYNILLSQ